MYRINGYVMPEDYPARLVVKASPDAVSCEFGDGLAILDLRSNVYYSVNTVGAFIWEFIQEPKAVFEIHDAVAARYTVDSARCRADVDNLLTSMTDAGLVTQHDEEFI